MATFGEIKTKVSGRLLDPNNTSVSSSDVASAVNDAIRYWKYREMWFNVLYSSQTMTLQDGTIPLPSDFLCPATTDGAFNIEYSEQRYNLRKINTEQYNAMWQGNGYGMPCSYARVGQDYEAYPLPDRAYTINISYLRDYDDLVNDSDTNDFTNNASRLITLWATANLIGEFKQDEKMESYFRNGAENEYNNLLLMSNNSNATGSLTVY